MALLALAGVGIGYKIIRNYYYVSAYADTVAIMRGIQGSILGIRLQQPYLLGCINGRGELSQISYGQETGNLGCHLMRLGDLRPPGRTQVTAGLPAGSLDDAIGQLRELAHNSLLPLCAPAGAINPPAINPPAVSPGPTAAPRSGSVTPAAPTPTKSPGTSVTSPQPSAAPLPAPQQTPGTDCRVAA